MSTFFSTFYYQIRTDSFAEYEIELEISKSLERQREELRWMSTPVRSLDDASLLVQGEMFRNAAPVSRSFFSPFHTQTLPSSNHLFDSDLSFDRYGFNLLDGAAQEARRHGSAELNAKATSEQIK